MTLRQLELFLAVSRARTFRAAAQAAALSQPALSQQIAELERELGLPVFDRLGRRVELTSAGRLLEEHARRVFATLQGARDAIAELRGAERGSLRLGGSTTPGIYVLPALLGRFTARHPRVDLALVIGNTREIEQRVRAAEVDLGIVGGHLAGFKETCVEASLVDRLVLIVSPEHPWADQGAVRPDRLAEARLLVREEGSATRQVAETALARAGAGVRNVLEMGHTEAIKRGVRAGLGVAIVSRYAVETEVAAGHLRALEVDGLAIERHFHVIRHEARSLTPAARAFLEVLRQDGSLPGRQAASSRGSAVRSTRAEPCRRDRPGVDPRVPRSTNG